MSETTFYSPRDIATRWGVSYQTVLKVIRRGELHAFRAGKVLLVSSDALRDYETRPYQPGTKPRRNRATQLKIS